MTAKKESKGNDKAKTNQGPQHGATQVPQRQAADAGEKPIPASRVDALAACLAKAGSLVLAREEQETLTCPFDPADVQTSPDKRWPTSYLPHTLIARRLNKALGVGQWAIVRLREWTETATATVYGSYALIVRGVWVGDTVAGWRCNAADPDADYADALESTRGVALRRMAAKSLGCGDQVWLKTPECPPEAPTSPQPRPDDNGKPTPPPQGKSVPVNAEYRQLLDRLKMAAMTGAASLQVEWQAIGKESRIMMASELSFLKQMAAEADAQIETGLTTHPPD